MITAISLQVFRLSNKLIFNVLKKIDRKITVLWKTAKLASLWDTFKACGEILGGNTCS